MSKAIILFSILPVRSAASEAAEMTTQLLFGETCEVLTIEGRWAQIRNDYDGQEGWVDAKMITLMSDEEAASYAEQMQKSESQAFVRMPMAFAVSQNNQTTLPLTAGTRLCNYKVEGNVGSFEILGVRFSIDPMMVMPQPMPLNRDSMMLLTRFFLNTPYLWAGKNVLGMDCSGFTQLVYGMMGVQLLRNASEQITQGTRVCGAEKGEICAGISEDEMKQVKACDLAFFDHGDGKITHVGILLGNGTIIHCSGRVKVEKITEKGIVSSENNALYKVGDLTHNLHSIRRYGE